MLGALTAVIRPKMLTLVFNPILSIKWIVFVCKNKLQGLFVLQAWM